VIHGKDDPLVPWEGGRDTCDAVPCALMMTIKGMGHDLPRAVWPQIQTAIVQLACQIDGPIGSSEEE
jgi:poly(3-hydroxybutyrate) depolymerase